MGVGVSHTLMGVGHSPTTYFLFGVIYWSMWPKGLSLFNVVLVVLPFQTCQEHSLRRDLRRVRSWSPKIINLLCSSDAHAIFTDFSVFWIFTGPFLLPTSDGVFYRFSSSAPATYIHTFHCPFCFLMFITNCSQCGQLDPIYDTEHNISNDEISWYLVGESYMTTYAGQSISIAFYIKGSKGVMVLLSFDLHSPYKQPYTCTYTESWHYTPQAIRVESVRKAFGCIGIWPTLNNSNQILAWFLNLLLRKYFHISPQSVHICPWPWVWLCLPLSLINLQTHKAGAF